MGCTTISSSKLQLYANPILHSELSSSTTNRWMMLVAILLSTCCVGCQSKEYTRHTKESKGRWVERLNLNKAQVIRLSPEKIQTSVFVFTWPDYALDTCNKVFAPRVGLQDISRRFPDIHPEKRHWLHFIVATTLLGCVSKEKRFLTLGSKPIRFTSETELILYMPHQLIKREIPIDESSEYVWVSARDWFK